MSFAAMRQRLVPPAAARGILCRAAVACGVVRVGEGQRQCAAHRPAELLNIHC